MPLRLAPTVTIVGGGLAGCEAAWQAAQMGVPVTLYEMRPIVSTPAHKTGKLAELVCSNSLRSDLVDKPAGLLKEEMRRLNSLIIRCADQAALPGGGALTVDREKFAQLVTDAIERHPLITVVRETVTKIPAVGPVIIATGPLTHDALAEEIRQLIGADFLYFYDAVSPIVDAETVDSDKCFWGSRYRDEPAYLNCPMTQEEYRRFWEALVAAERHEPHDFEKTMFFEGCLPIEEMARRGYLTLVYGPLRPTGLIDPRTGKRPFAVVQLRPENAERTMFNMVGFQTTLKWSEQQRVFRLIPGLERAEFLRFGYIHRNTYINAPIALRPTYQFKGRDDLFFAGQLTGVEGYIESAASGLVAGINAARLLRGEPPLVFPRETAIGALAHYITTADPKHFTPMNINFGLLPPLERKVHPKELRHRMMVARALQALEAFIARHGLTRGQGKYEGWDPAAVAAAAR
ncbi:Methylenetetrahydrofolate--tRNA-(uracil-5-)-methyltransferase TrmFO [bacterium HR17]|uniref:Methylenetetrahydrofolate--tRNA-(uracil-5-)-methyltransferase TrmFO n=1 Tax=Candidatus Fervidibacter japonicus TaxID=2035412 RepID=A0A2H5XDQ5_9BACT|nr:Methylenetetrahydrofolate--tRNA-(uracil-5-)-methyltransferase TrmFO [bacterium HR17]